MSAFSRTQIDGIWLGGSYVPGAADWMDLDAKIFRAMNGDRGGAWAPSSPITFLSGNISITGPAVVAYGGELRTSFNVDDEEYWPQFGAEHPFRTREILNSLATVHITPIQDWMFDPESYATQSVALLIQGPNGSYLRPPPPMRTPLRVHDRATLRTAAFTFRVPQTRNAAPLTMPKFRIIRADKDGAIVQLASTASGADRNGWRSPAKVSTPAAWMNDGLAQTFTYSCDQNNVIDVSKYQYFAEIIEEGVEQTFLVGSQIDGGVRREQKSNVRCATTGPVTFPLTGALVIDGVTCADGDRVLVKDQLPGSGSYNGIWVARSGEWKRAADCDEQADITKGFIVKVAEGARNDETLWMATAPYPQSYPAFSADGFSDLLFERLKPAGNKFHSVLLAFDGIIDMRWQ